VSGASARDHLVDSSGRTLAPHGSRPAWCGQRPLPGALSPQSTGRVERRCECSRGTYGSQRYNWPVVYITVATIVVIVQAGQFLGNWLARRALRR
jgi:hypothetical protein